ncbi:hypothetical protein BDV06DRAFT_229655 [Aspergillus oleicola]
MAVPTITLDNGAQMPIVGFGLWKVSRDTCADQVYNLIMAGYRLLDGTCIYENESECGEGVARAIADGLVKRSDLFIVSKLWNNFHDGDKIDYFDLFLMHFPISLEYIDPAVQYPPPDGPEFPPGRASVQETWKAMEGLVDAGLARGIGVSNFNGGLILDLLKYARIKPATLQIEHHPYLTQETLVKYAQSQGITVTAYSSFGPSSYRELEAEDALSAPLLLEHPVVLLRWATQRSVAVIPKSSNPNRLAQNLKVTDFDLAEEEIKKISELNKGPRFNDPMKFGEPHPIFF